MIDDRTLSALEHLVHSIRSESNLSDWDAQGVTAVLTSLRHLALAELVARVGHLAGHADTKSPGRLRTGWQPEIAATTVNARPTPDEACDSCGHFAHRCQCVDDDGRRMAPTPRHRRTGKPMDPALRAAVKSTVANSRAKWNGPTE